MRIPKLKSIIKTETWNEDAAYQWEHFYEISEYTSGTSEACEPRTV